MSSPGISALARPALPIHSSQCAQQCGIAPLKKTLTHAARVTWLLVGLIALALGFIGIFLPLLPTTPFILLAAFAFANSSERLHTWLVNHNVFGRMIENWQRYGAISTPAKIAAAVSMIGVLVLSMILGAPGWIIVIQAVVLSASCYFVLSRPSPPEE